MTATRGCLGVIEVGATPAVVGELTAYTANAVADEIDTSSMGTCTASSIAGNKKTTGTISVNWDPADAGQVEFVIGEVVQLILYPQGKDEGSTVLTAAEATILSNNLSAEVNGVVAGEISYSLNGEFVKTVQPAP